MHHNSYIKTSIKLKRKRIRNWTWELPVTHSPWTQTIKEPKRKIKTQKLRVARFITRKIIKKSGAELGHGWPSKLFEKRGFSATFFGRKETHLRNPKGKERRETWKEGGWNQRESERTKRFPRDTKRFTGNFLWRQYPPEASEVSRLPLHISREKGNKDLTLGASLFSGILIENLRADLSNLLSLFVPKIE